MFSSSPSIMLSFARTTTSAAALPTSSSYYQTINALCLEDAIHTLSDQTSVTCRSGMATADSSPFCTLPIEIQLHILSYLDASSLCSLSRACSCLGCVSTDPMLWRALLLKDSLKWSVIGHLSHPQVYQDACSDLHPKRVYSQCYANRGGTVQKSSFTNYVTGRIKWFIGRLNGHVPKVLVFGSGMESLPFIHMLLWEKSSPFKPIGMYPGKDGVGSGVCIENSDGSPVNLVTLYTSNKIERKMIQQNQRVNRLTKSPESVELTRSVSDLCQQADAYMLIVDANTGPNDDVDKVLLNSMLQSGPSQTPLLVVGATCEDGDGTVNKLQPLDIADRLELCKLPHHPWQVRQTTLGTFSGLQDGLCWLLGKNY